MIIIETTTEYKDFLNRSKGYDWIVVPTYCNGDRSAHIDDVSVIYIYVLHLDEEVMLVCNHTEGLNLTSSILSDFPTDNKLFVHGKKRFKNFLDRTNLIDIDMVEYFQRNKSIEDEFDTTAHEFFTRTVNKFANINTIIPIVKHIEKSQAITQRFLDVYSSFQYDKAFEKYNELVLDSLYQIEKNGLYANYDQFTNKFPNNVLHDNFIYSEYNVYTTTGRPSNRFGGINFAALNKETGQRTPFVSRFGENGFMMSFDYDAYHLRLLADLIDFQFPNNVSVHEYLGTFYFSKPILTEEEYLESKSISFRQLYGGIAKEYLDIPFFSKVHEYTKLLWEQYKDNGFIETPLFGRKLHHHYFTDMNASKLLNYMLQAFETERNMAVIHNILSRIQSFSSKLILYTYDSFLFDFDKRDGGEIIHIIKQELEQNKKYPTKIEVGPDYSNMITIKR